MFLHMQLRPPPPPRYAKDKTLQTAKKNVHLKQRSVVLCVEGEDINLRRHVPRFLHCKLAYSVAG